jgi:hypothetical protein
MEPRSNSRPFPKGVPDHWREHWHRCERLNFVLWRIAELSGFLHSGKGTAQDLLAHNAKVYIAGRSAERVTEAIEDLKKTTGKGDDSVKFLKLDLADLKSVKTAVDEFLSSVLTVLRTNTKIIDGLLSLWVV